MARVSIITALYNHERYVADAIESVLAQTYGDWELLLWDDGSSDGSLAIACRYAEKHPDRIRVFTHPGGANLGQETTRNAAIRESMGEILCLLDSDDIYEPRKLELLVPKLADPKVGLAYGEAQFLAGSTGRRYPSGVRNNPEGQVFDALVEENFVCAGTTLFRRECLAAEGIRFDASLRTCGEYPVWLAISKTWNFAFVPEVVACWRDHGENLGTKLALQAKRELVTLCERLAADPAYVPHAAAIRRALARRRYDFASLLYQELDLEGARNELLKILVSPDAPVRIQLKALALRGAASLGKAPNRVLSRAKRRLWEIRRDTPAPRKS